MPAFSRRRLTRPRSFARLWKVINFPKIKGVGDPVVYNCFSLPPAFKGKGLPVWLLFYTCLLLSLMLTDGLSAQDAPQELRIEYQDQLLDISARNVDIKDFFTRLAEKTNITIEFPASLKRQITLNKKNVSLSRFLSSFLRNMNHVIIYSGSGAGKSRIDEVQIYPKSTASRPSTLRPSSLSGGSQDRIRQQIENYQKVVERLRNTLSSVGENNNRRQVYLNRIRRYENRIKNLENQLN
jgi:hypothetical protein